MSLTRRPLLSGIIGSLILVTWPHIAHAQYAFFDTGTDTIQLSGTTLHGTTATFEARLCLSGTGGMIYNEWQNARLDKFLAFGPVLGVDNQISGFAYLVSTPSNPLLDNVILDNSFHNVAFVKDTTEERLYFDGKLVARQDQSGTIANGSPDEQNNPGIGFIQRQVGAINRDGRIVESFTGYLDSIRISSIARYDANYAPATGDFAADGNTDLLYDFNPSDLVGNNLTDLSGNNRNGTLGTGFAGATASTIVNLAVHTPEPPALPLILTALVLMLKRRNQRGELSYGYVC